MRFALLALCALILCAGCSGVSATQPPLDRSADLTPPRPQILVGVNPARLYNEFPGTDIERLFWTAFERGVTLYGDDVYAPKWTGHGLDFADCDRIVPLMLAHPMAANMSFWFPVSDHSLDKLGPTYLHWKQKGWFNAADWFFFIPGISDEVRETSEIIQNNTMYLQYKAAYPEIKWMTTREATQFDDEKPQPLADIFLPMFHMYEIEKYVCNLGGGNIDDVYAGVIRGGYISGWTDQPESLEPEWYASFWLYTLHLPPPNVPVLTTEEAGDIIGYCANQGMKYFLYWDINGLVEVINGKTVPNDLARKMVGL